MKRPRVLIADDHLLLMDALKRLLEPEFEVLETVSDGKALVSRALQLNPDLIILDLALPLLNGMDAGRQLKELLPKTKLLVVTVNEDPRIAVKALRNEFGGAVGLVLKLPIQWWPLLPPFVLRSYFRERRRIRLMVDHVPPTMLFPE